MEIHRLDTMVCNSPSKNCAHNNKCVFIASHCKSPHSTVKQYDTENVHKDLDFISQNFTPITNQFAFICGDFHFAHPSISLSTKTNNKQSDFTEYKMLSEILCKYQLNMFNTKEESTHGMTYNDVQSALDPTLAPNTFVQNQFEWNAVNSGGSDHKPTLTTFRFYIKKCNNNCSNDELQNE